MLKRALYITLITIGVTVIANIVIAMTVSSPNITKSSHRYLTLYRNALKAEKPEVVLIGNSMLDNGVDPKKLSTVLEKGCVKLALGGSASASWYLIFKNVVLFSRHKPKTVVFFFRDTFLTLPNYRTRARYKLFIDDLSNGEEPILQQLAYHNAPEIEAPTNILDRVLPAYARRNNLKATIDGAIKNELVGNAIGAKLASVNRSIGLAFQEKKMIQSIIAKQQIAVETIIDKKATNFNDILQSSFLPHIVEMAQQAEIKLVFVRIKRRRDVGENRETPELKQYIFNLRQYLNQYRYPLVDFTDDPRLTLEHYGTADHLNRIKGKVLFTRILGQRLKPHIH